ncbi:uncharacterized protein MAL13P1.304-like [Bicyclus anynana]|uniref:Uncharacterized protein MAL13P1.304-like n=1 Tax=Bicyclus anynana TaxID=110368 RepID=A0A6J1NFN1_BICAN|nr:uncharacterized protein MAL13P1.304-like [Bicyclus anynana]
MMWILLFVSVLLLKQNLITSEQVSQEAENIRAPRQLNFGECCPCPTQDVFQDQDTANTINTALSDDCPCRPTSDSVGASSIYSPAFRAVEPFIKPLSKKEEPKPLLNPEVGLASSVLETLQEVTDQEYQEALARDAARSALKLIDPEPLESESRDVVDVILSPKEQNNDEMVSQATEFQRNTCILPPLGTKNNFEPLRLQPPINLLKQILTPMKFRSNGILNRKGFDMDGSASNSQDRILPLKENILENMKTRSNFLNLRPFTDSRDVIASPNLQKYYVKSNIRDRILSRNRPLLDVQPTTSNKLSELFARTAAGGKKIGTEPDITPDFIQYSPEPYDFTKDERKMKANPKDSILENSDCKEINTSPENNEKDFDAAPSSSNTVEVKTPTVAQHQNIIQQNRDADIGSDKLLDVDTVTDNYNTLQAPTAINCLHDEIEATTEGIIKSVRTVDVETIQSEFQYTTENLENIKDMEPESSITRNVIKNLEDTPTEDCISSNVEKKNENFRSAIDSVPSISAEKGIVTSNPHTLPNIKADIFKTLENFKKANELIQDKLRSNVQDALKLVITSEPTSLVTQTATYPVSEMRASSMESTQTFKNNAINNNLGTQDLQKMSDSLLELNSLKVESDSSTTPSCKEKSTEKIPYKSIEVDEVSNLDMITSPTTSEDVKSNLDTEGINNSDETLKSACGNNIISKNGESNIINNEENEMSAQPSNSAYNTISQLDSNLKDFIVQSHDKIKPMEGIKDLFSNFRYLGADTFTNDNNDSEKLAKQPLYRNNNDNNNINTLKSFNGQKSYNPSFNTDTKLSSYKAKVASPKLLDKSTVPHLNKEADVLGLASQRIPQTTNFKNMLSNVEDGINPVLKSIYNGKMPQDSFSSKVPSISKNFESHANEALKSFRDSLNLAEREPFAIKKNNVLGRSLVNPDKLFENVLKTHEDFNTKLKAFHSDLNKRLSSRIPSDIPRLLTPSRLNTPKNRAESNNFSSKKSGTTLGKPVSSMKNTLLSKNRPLLETLQKKPPISVITPRPNIKPKLSVHQRDSSTKKSPITLNPPKINKLKPLKENKVTISFATTSIRPDTLKSRFNSEPVKLPKFSKPLVNKKLIPKSKFESNEPKVLASDISLSKSPPDTVRQTKLTEKIPLPDESEISEQNDNRRFINMPETNKSKLLSKLKNGFSTGIPSTKRYNEFLSSKQNKNALDAAQSASNNMDSNIAATSLVSKTLNDDKHPFKCKMVCIQDILDSKDTYDN